MPLFRMWIKPEVPVITPLGKAKIVELDETDDEKVWVELAEPWAGKTRDVFDIGEVALDTPNTLISILMVTGVGLITSAVNYPEWPDVYGKLASCPYASDETLLGFDFRSEKVLNNRRLPLQFPYQIVRAYFDLHAPQEILAFEGFAEARNVWERRFVSSMGDSAHLLIAVFIDLKRRNILAKGLYSTVRVLELTTYF